MTAGAKRSWWLKAEGGGKASGTVRSSICTNNEQPMTRVCVLGSGSKGNAIYISNERVAVLVDAGLSGIEIERRLAARRINPETLDAIVVSHEHSDHIHGVGVLSRRLRLPVYITPQTMSAAGPFLGDLHEVHHFHPGQGFALDGLHVHPFSVSHDAADPVGFTIQDRNVKIGIATDLGVATQLVCHHLRGCTLMILEANHDRKMLEDGPYPWELKQRIRSRHGHLSNEESRDLLREVLDGTLEHVVVAHVSEKNNLPERAVSVVREALSDHRACLRVAFQHAAGEVISLP